MFKRSKARKSTKKTIEESSSNNSLIKSPRKFSNMINKMYNISQENEDEDPQFEINFPIAELDIDLPSGTIEAELTGTEFWFKKGKEATNKWAIEAAIDYYIQGLWVDSRHLKSYHNLGCCYVYIDKCSSSLKYFK